VEGTITDRKGEPEIVLRHGFSLDRHKVPPVKTAQCINPKGTKGGTHACILRRGGIYAAPTEH
jgi:hypothetical protein